jgi:ATP-binding cassette subfamily B (MDR/TAP) protein 1
LNIHWIRSRFGLVSQEPILFNLTIAENITYGLENIPMENIINAATKANIHSFIEQLPQVSHKTKQNDIEYQFNIIFRVMKQK